MGLYGNLAEGSAEDLTLFASFRFFPSRSGEGAGSIGRGRVSEGLSMCICRGAH